MEARWWELYDSRGWYRRSWHQEPPAAAVANCLWCPVRGDFLKEEGTDQVLWLPIILLERKGNMLLRGGQLAFTLLLARDGEVLGYVTRNAPP